MTLTYRLAEGMQQVALSAHNTWSVVPLGETTSQLRIEAEVDLASTGRALVLVLRPYLSAMGRRNADDFKTYVETGRPSERKRRQEAGMSRLAMLVAGNAIFTAASGAVLVVGSGWWANQLGGVDAPIVAVLGTSLAAGFHVPACSTERRASKWSRIPARLNSSSATDEEPLLSGAYAYALEQSLAASPAAEPGLAQLHTAPTKTCCEVRPAAPALRLVAWERRPAPTPVRLQRSRGAAGQARPGAAPGVPAADRSRRATQPATRRAARRGTRWWGRDGCPWLPRSPGGRACDHVAARDHLPSKGAQHRAVHRALALLGTGRDCTGLVPTAPIFAPVASFPRAERFVNDGL